MRVVPLEPDVPRTPSAAALPDGKPFAAVVDGIAGALRRADAAETAYGGALQDAILERARADAMLSAATATAQRVATALQSILNLQI